MKTKFTLLFITFLFAAHTHSYAFWRERITPSKNYITKEVKIDNFNALKSNIVGNVYYVQSDIVSVKIYGPDNIVPLIRTEKKGATLCFDTKKSINSKKGYKLDIFVSGPSLTEISANGVGNVCLKENVKLNSLIINNGGVGNVEIEQLTCEDVKMKLSGVGDIKIKGYCKRAEFKHTGVGKINAYDLKVDNLRIDATGVGDVKCNANQSLYISQNGVGSVRYKGNASVEIKKNNITGSVKKVN